MILFASSLALLLRIPFRFGQILWPCSQKIINADRRVRSSSKKKKRKPNQATDRGKVWCSSVYRGILFLCLDRFTILHPPPHLFCWRLVDPRFWGFGSSSRNTASLSSHSPLCNDLLGRRQFQRFFAPHCHLLGNLREKRLGSNYESLELIRYSIILNKVSKYID